MTAINCWLLQWVTCYKTLQLMDQRILPQFWSGDIEYPLSSVFHWFGCDIASDDYNLVKILLPNCEAFDEFNDVRVYGLKN